MITVEDIIGPWDKSPDLTPERRANITRHLIPAVWALQQLAKADGIDFPANPLTSTCVSGQRYGGFRPQACSQGAARSNHKEGLAVDVYDPHNAVDQWCFANLDKLERCGIWIEHPDATPHWSHWQCVPPHSGKRVFNP